MDSLIYIKNSKKYYNLLESNVYSNVADKARVTNAKQYATCTTHSEMKRVDTKVH